MTALAIAVVLAIPLLVLVVLPRLVDRRAQRRQQVVLRQIALTDAIHSALGPVVAPVVRRGRHGWIGVLSVPAGDPHVARMVEIAQKELGSGAEIHLVGGPEMAPYAPRRSARPGPAVARLDYPAA
jgi:hypothetical protein